MPSSNSTVEKWSSEEVSLTHASVRNWSMVGVLWWHRLRCTEGKMSALLWAGLLALELKHWLHPSLGLTGLSSLELVNARWHWGCGICVCNMKTLHAALESLVTNQSLSDWRIDPPPWRHSRLLEICWEGWGCWSFHYNSHNLHPPVQVQFQMYHSEWSWSDQREFLLVDFITVVCGHYRRRLCKIDLWHCWGCAVQGLLSRTDVLSLQHSIWNTLVPKANFARFPRCWCVDGMQKLVEWLRFSAYVGNWKHWCKKAPICIWWIQIGWSKPLVHVLWCGSMCLLSMHFFKGGKVLFLECQSRSTHVVIAGSSGYCPSIVNLPFP